ncbi:RHS repeat-associated core domain-containing protein [Pedobacter soli]|uniref:RHS repeat-associated core domain-containing protein n=1 Tax=Pedobacter soli TaxID=390242 RepID=A0A1G6WL90_9SPHI|nr:FG-GAP-like repeat-containing protein [Pedobacter soli]SDD65987.1 RHS repeat-associated core domain-containing protein [Pedobacter soli]
MKHFLLSSFFSVFFIAFCSAQTQPGKSTKQADTSVMDSTSVKPLLFKEIRYVEGAVPVSKKDTLALKGAKGGKVSRNTANKVVAPGDPGDPGYPPVDPVDPVDPPSGGVTVDAGRTASSLDVSATGGSTYSVPITVPPGIGKVLPQLSISYNSQAGRGIAGLGWSVTGLSAIRRISTSMFHDGRIDGVNFNQTDRFALDGQRLLPKSGIYGADGSEYQTENYSNLRIISHGSSPFGNNSGPEYFEVLYPDGSKAFYGSSSSSRTPDEYALTYTENPVGARISYQYLNANNVMLISQIEYGGIGAAAGINQVVFSYGYAYRAEQGYTGGISSYQDRILDKISVIGSGSYTRHYKLSYGVVGTLNYQKLISIQEFNGSEQSSFSPIYFSYGATNDVVVTNTISNLSLSGIASNNSEILTADFTGNGTMDFLLYPNGYKDKFWAFYDMEPNSPYYQVGYQVNTGAFLDIFPTTSLSWNNKVLSGQGMLLVKQNGSNAFKFDVYSSGTVQPVYYQYTKTWDNVPAGPAYFSDYDYQTHDGMPLTMKFVSGDFNGDGLTDIIAVNDGFVVTHESLEYYQDPWDDRASYYYGMPQYEDRGSNAYFVNMDRGLTANYVTNLGGLAQTYITGEKLLTGDFNGDGKTDILHVKNGVMNVYSMNSTGGLQLLWNLPDNRISLSQQILLGDYNGDGKLDVMFSTGNNSLFATFMSTGKSFEKREQYQPFNNTAGTWNGNPPGTLDLYYLVANDVDGDGKTDILSSRTVTTNNSNYGSTYMTVYYSGAPSSNGQPNFFYGASTSNYGPLKHYPIPIFLNPSKPNVRLEFGFMSNNSISLYRFNRDFKIESQLTSVNQDGVTHAIEYKSIDSEQVYTNDIQVYAAGYDQSYPYVDLQTIPGLNVVSKVTRYYGSEQLSQVFGYGKAVSHAGGLGFLGFGEVIRSNWSTGNGDNNRNFTTQVFDPQLRGALVRQFVSKSTYINPSIKNMVFTSPPANAGVADGASLTDYISRSDQAFSSQLLANKVFINVAVATCEKDMLKNTFQTQVAQYDGYFNRTKTTNNINGVGSQIVEVTYDNNPSGYYIGRPLKVSMTLNNGSDVTSKEEEYTYSGFLPTQAKKKGQGTGWLTEDIQYDSFGNLKQKTVTAPGGGQRTMSMIYDASGRFVISSTDVNGISSGSVYDPVMGNKLSSTSPTGQVESYVYDTWGRLVTTTDYLSTNSQTSYQRDGFNILITDTDDEGHSSISVTNALGQVIEVRKKNILGQYIGTATQYDVYGRESAVSEPSQAGNYSQWNTTSYDEYGRSKQTVSYTGKIVNLSYNGLSITANDGVKTITTTNDAFGKIASLVDPGGTINYTHFANGNVKTVNYGGFVQSIEQDGWGRKTKLTDPSAGIYQYEYDNWGQLTKEVSPKGYTEYKYDAAGNLDEKKIVGDGTNMKYNYTYDPATRLISNLALTNSDGNNASYSYSYDSYKRLSSTVEDNLHARFVRSYTYDSFGRVITEGYEAKDKQSNITVQKVIEKQYQNGELLQTVFQGTGQVIWKLNNLDSKGKLSISTQGLALKNTYQYNSYGLPQQTIVENVSGNPVTLMDLGYTFDSQRGLLTNRSNSAFNWAESFSYDNQDRLTNFNDNQGNKSQTYDNRGRILNNSELGDYTYDGGSYKQTELDLSNNATANGYYQQEHALQQISYNAFKAPVEIIEQGKERISFQYNAGMSRSHVYYGDEQADPLNRRFRRHYSEDGGMEITSDMQTGKTSFIFYLDGDPYSAPAIWKEEFQSSQHTQNLYFLHRDYLGSIVMITDEQGGVVEKRQFDAWGNILKIEDGYGNALAVFQILDRGFTGHEHLLGVGLIHMNGRLYDPKLHRFLSPDNNIQDPSNTQNFNRYAYAMNNPLMFTDPSGEFIFAFLIPLVGKLVATIITGAIIGAGVGAVSYTASVGLSNGGFKNWDWGQFGKSVGFGALSGAVTMGIGEQFGGIGKFGHEMLRGAAHGLAQGGISELSGGKFLTGFATGAISSVAGSAWGTWGGDFADSPIGMLAFSAVSGGVTAELTGGDFWRGASTGAIIAGLNHLAHNLFQPDPNERQLKLLSKGEIQKLKDSGWDHSDKQGGGKIDLYKDKDGWVYEVRKGGNGPPEPTYINLKNLDQMKVYNNGWWHIKYRSGLTLPVISPAPVVTVPVMPTMPIIAPRIVAPRIFLPELLPIF